MNLKKTKAIKQRKYCVLSEKVIVGLDRNVKSTAIKISMKMLVLEIILAGMPDLSYFIKAKLVPKCYFYVFKMTQIFIK